MMNSESIAYRMTDWPTSLVQQTLSPFAIRHLLCKQGCFLLVIDERIRSVAP
jgi:hypothetical protein